MRIYQVLVIGSFVALAACKTDDADTNVAPVVEQAPANDRVEPATAGKQDDRVDANGRPIGATDPIRTPTP